MGVIRSTPDKLVKSSLQDYSTYYAVTGAVCGWQLFMQDYNFLFSYSQHIRVMGIIDGQSGPQIAQFCHNQIQQIIQNCQLMKIQQYQAAIQNLCFTLDQKIKNSHEKINKIRHKYNLPQLPKYQESPASASIIICIIDEQSVVIGNLGQCKSYVSYKNSQNTFVLISGNHMIEREQDTETINKKGGFVVDNLINGKYLHSKGIGNLKYKNLNYQSKSLISTEPSVFTLRLQDLNAIVMGSSGLWQNGQIVMKRIFDKKLNPLQQKQNIQNIIGSLVAQSSQQYVGLQNITVKAIIMNDKKNKYKK